MFFEITKHNKVFGFKIVVFFCFHQDTTLQKRLLIEKLKVEQIEKCSYMSALIFLGQITVFLRLVQMPIFILFSWVLGFREFSGRPTRHFWKSCLFWGVCFFCLFLFFFLGGGLGFLVEGYVFWGGFCFFWGQKYFLQFCTGLGVFAPKARYSNVCFFFFFFFFFLFFLFYFFFLLFSLLPCQLFIIFLLLLPSLASRVCFLLSCFFSFKTSFF